MPSLETQSFGNLELSPGVVRFWGDGGFSKIEICFFLGWGWEGVGSFSGISRFGRGWKVPEIGDFGGVLEPPKLGEFGVCKTPGIGRFGALTPNHEVVLGVPHP